MHEMLPFLRAIAATPEDDTPRLVFADWLDEHDLPDRAEFIRLQCALARMNPSDDGYAEKTAAMRRCGIFTRQGTVLFFDHLPDAKCRIAFRRGFIDAIDTLQGAEMADTSGFDLVPLQSLRTTESLIDKFRGFSHLKWLDFTPGRAMPPARLLEVFGSGGWFSELETLCLHSVETPCFAAGVIPRFELPHLRNFFLTTGDFFSMGAVDEEGDGDDDDDYYRRRSWGGLPDFLPANAIPKSPLERFVWHTDDDSDSFGDDGYGYYGPTMEAFLTRMGGLRQLEVAGDYDDHEGGGEGPVAAPHGRNPLDLSATLEHVTLSLGEVALIADSARKLKGLRVYGSEYHAPDDLFPVLGRSVCSELEALHIEMGGGWGEASGTSPSIAFPKLRSLHLDELSLEWFSNCDFPSLLSLAGVDLTALLARKWPRLQRLELHARQWWELKALAKSDCCPDLTTLMVDGYFSSKDFDLSFLTRCPHMPHLSLVRVGRSYSNQAFIIDDGRLLPIRPDVLVEGLTPSTLYRLPAVF